MKLLAILAIILLVGSLIAMHDTIWVPDDWFDDITEVIHTENFTMNSTVNFTITIFKHPNPKIICDSIGCFDHNVQGWREVTIFNGYNNERVLYNPQRRAMKDGVKDE